MDAGPAIHKIVKDYKNKVRLVVKMFPYYLRDYAQMAAESAFAANEQGKFWEMHLIMLKNSPALDKPSLLKYAKDIGIDTVKFGEALDKKRFASNVEKDKKLATDIGLYSTPTVFINGIKIVGNRPYSYYKKVIDEELKNVKK